MFKSNLCAKIISLALLSTSIASNEYWLANVWRINRQPKPFEKKDLPKPGECGTQRKYQSLSSVSIYGGHNVTIFEYPWVALLEYQLLKKKFLCAGAIINKNYILTAAHCIKLDYAELISVRLGEHNLLTDPDCDWDECADPVVNIPVAKTIVHRDFNKGPGTLNNDIALIRVAQPIHFTDWVKPICLPTQNTFIPKNFAGVPLIVAGLGGKEYRSMYFSDVMLQVGVNGTSNYSCRKSYEKRPFYTQISTKQLCAGGVEGQDSCAGDSGGPLMEKHKTWNGTVYTYAAGIVSFGPASCGTEGVPGVYTRVDKYIDWIVENMQH